MSPVTRTAFKWLDNLILLWVMPPLGFVLTLLQSPQLQYLIAYYTLAAGLAGAIFIRWMIQAPTPQLAWRLLTAALLACSFLGIEWLHFLAGRPTIDELTDLRMIVYSPIYGSIILFVLYCFYLVMLSEGEQQRHLIFFVRLMCWFHVIFLVYWLLLFTGFVTPVPRSNLLRSNSAAYGALFVVALMLNYHERVWRRLSAVEIVAFTVVNVGVMFANRTRGAILGLAAVLLCLLLLGLGWRRVPAFVCATVASILMLVLSAEGTVLIMLLGQDASAFSVVLSQIAEAYESGTIDVSLSAELVNDEGSLSAFSRIGSIFYSLLSFIDHPLLGIGQKDAYRIDVIGSGVHSMHLLIANATGLAGLIIFIFTLAILISAQGPLILSRNHAVTLILCFGFMPLFINSIPIYFALVLAVLTRAYNSAGQLGSVPAVPFHPQSQRVEGKSCVPSP